MTALGVAGLGLGAAMALAFLAGSQVAPALTLGRVRQEMAALRDEVAGYRATHEHLTDSLERRLDDLEQATARAANEVRMVTDQVMEQFAVEPAAGVEPVPAGDAPAPAHDESA